MIIFIKKNQHIGINLFYGKKKKNDMLLQILFYDSKQQVATNVILLKNYLFLL